MKFKSSIPGARSFLSRRTGGRDLCANAAARQRLPQAGEWQSFDIVFTAPKFEGERLVEPARVTMFHNGALAHLNQEVFGETGHRILPEYKRKVARPAPAERSRLSGALPEHLASARFEVLFRGARTLAFGCQAKRRADFRIQHGLETPPSLRPRSGEKV